MSPALSTTRARWTATQTHFQNRRQGTLGTTNCLTLSFGALHESPRSRHAPDYCHQGVNRARSGSRKGSFPSHVFASRTAQQDLRVLILRYTYTQRGCYFNERGQPALTRVSSQVRKESPSIYFGVQSLPLAAVLFSPRESLVLEEPRPISSNIHTLDRRSFSRLGHIYSHTDLLRQVTMEMDISAHNQRLIHMVLVIKRDVQATPQYSTEASYGRQLRYIIQQGHRVSEFVEEETTWAGRPRPGQPLAKRNGESIARFIGRQAQSILDQRQKRFAFTKRKINSFLRELPVRVCIDKAGVVSMKEE